MDSGNEMYFENDELPAKTKSKKDTKRWCRGKPGKEHAPIVGVTGWPSGPCRYETRLWGRDKGAKFYYCKHGIVCEQCGKMLQYRLTGDLKCPEWETAWETYLKLNG